MVASATPLLSLWRQVWRRTPLTIKALFASLLIGGSFWLFADLWQTTHVQTIFRKKLLNELDIQAQQDRILFDEYIRQQEQSARMLSFLTPFVSHADSAIKTWKADPTRHIQWVGATRPPWLPPRSVMRGLVAAPHILLFDGEKRLRESFLQEETLPLLPDILLEETLPDLLSESERSHIVTDPDGVVYLITATALQDKQMDADSTHDAYLALVAPMDNNFLALFHANRKTNSEVVFIHGESDRVFGSSQPDQIPVGMPLSELREKYMVFGKKFLDYSFSIHIPIHFATVVPVEEIHQISEAVVHEERKQRTIGYGILSSIFLVLVFAITKNIQRFTEKIIETAVGELELEQQNIVSGDQLLIMAERFQWMTNEILRVRQEDKKHQLELQNTNNALHQSLIMIKRAQTQLVEAEKMASLGSLVAGVAHEINTPMGTGLTAASFLEQATRTCADHFSDGTLRKSELEKYFGDALESTQMILQNLRRAAELIRSFKQVAVDRTSETERVFRLEEYIHHVLLSLRPRLKQTPHQVTVECPELLEIRSHPGAFSQIISNLIINSLMHGFLEQTSGKILIQVIKREGDILFRYSDNGRGMRESDRLQIFEPFFTTARHRGGSGLGMHIVFNLVTQTLKGTIRCISAPGQGTTYEILIPTDPMLTEA